MPGRKKITFIGGGSSQWVPLLFRDIAVNPHLQAIEFVLHDIDPRRNEEMAGVCRIIARKVGSSVIVGTEDRVDAAIDGAQAVVLCISTGGLDAMEHDIEIPKKYGIFQPVGDSTGPGGISRTLRNVPVVVDLVRRMERLCPQAWLLNLSNPMNQIVRTASPRIRTVGLCHEFKSFMGMIEGLLGLKDWQSETAATIAGINHFAWVQELTVHGRDGMALLRKRIDTERGKNHRRANGVNPSHSLSGDQVKFALLETYGLIPYPGDRHLVEFFPYFLSRKTRQGADFGVSLTTIEDRRVKWIKWYRQRIEEWTGGGDDSVPRQPSNEALAPILAALVSDGPTTSQAAVLSNAGQVPHLPLGCSVETMTTFAGGLAIPQATRVLPAGVLGLVQKHALNQDLMVEAALEGSRTKALQAMLADPLNNNNDYREIKAMLDELLQANAALLPQFFPKNSPRPPRRHRMLRPA